MLGLVLDRGGLGPLVLVVRVAKGNAKLKLLLRLSSTVELLPDRNVARIEDDV